MRGVGDQRADVENHRRGRAALHALAIDVEPHSKLLRIGDFVGGDQPRPEGTEGRAALALDPLAAAALELIGAFGDVVADAVPSDVVQRIALADIAGACADHDRQFDFPIGLFGPLGIITSSFGPTMQDGALVKRIGSFGIAMPNSAA